MEDPIGFDFKVNGKAAHSDAPSLTPLLWVIREELARLVEAPTGAPWSGKTVIRVRERVRA